MEWTFKKMKPPPSTLHHIVLLSWYHYWRTPINELDRTAIQTQLVTFSLCLPSNFPTASAFAPWSDFSSSRSTAFRFLQRWKKGVVSWEAKGTTTPPPPRNKALSRDYKPGLIRALFLGGGVAFGVPLDSHDVFHIVPLGKWTFKWMEMGWCTPIFSSKDLVCHPTETTILNSWAPKNGCEDGRWFFFSYLG